MLKTLIVIACHDHIGLLQRWLSRVEEVNFDHETTKFLFVDTCSTSTDFISFFQKEKDNNDKSYKVFERSAGPNYATGAYWHGYSSHPSENYIFVHDSTFIIDPDLVENMRSILENYEVATFYNFNYAMYIHMPDYSEAMIGIRPQIGFFGPMFCVRKSIMDRIPHEWMTLPTNKDEECAWERRWSVIFHALTESIHCLSGGFEYIDNNFQYIRKGYVQRQ